VQGRSHEHGWNERVGRRFSTEKRASAFADRMAAEGWYSVRVMYVPADTGEEAAP
jgi:hypothetical protein